MPYMIMVDCQIYELNDSAQEIPEDAVEGYITKVVPGNEMPNENQTANFGEVGKQYWKSDNKIYVHTSPKVVGYCSYTPAYPYNIFVPIEN